ncbi:hypothetical protein [Streptomyces sp. NPDC087297]|uniref:hypothetical protein n=1 Tax=Streptomyces sp. NPDC087297 TaxID=3365778 RepID=UPI003813991E
MNRNVPPGTQRTGTVSETAAVGDSLFLPGRLFIAPGVAHSGGTKRITVATRLALVPQFLEPAGLSAVDDGDEVSDER